MTTRSYTADNSTPPPLVSAINGIGSALRRAGIGHPLSTGEILKAARRRTRLHDWGNTFFLEPLQRLVDAFEDEANLTPFGRMVTRNLLIYQVSQRLYNQDYLQRHPEAATLELRAPVIVVGMPRTGTTLAYKLLCQDPANRPLMFWESIQPAPLRPLPMVSNRKILRGRIAARIIHRLAPGLKHVHPLDPGGPEECTWLMANTFVCPAFGMFGRIPSYVDWLWNLDLGTWSKVYEDYANQLRIIQHQRDTGQWVLKSPVHYMSLEPLLRAIPNARIIFTHRDSVDVVPSACSLFAVLRGMGTEHQDMAELGKLMLEDLARGMQRAQEAHDSHPDRVIKVHYQQLTKDPVETIRTIYTHFGIPFDDALAVGLDWWLAESKHVKSHTYGLDQFGLDPKEVQERFSDIGVD